MTHLTYGHTQLCASGNNDPDCGECDRLIADLYDDKSNPFSDPAVQLFGQIVSANVAESARITKIIEENDQRTIRRLAEGFLSLHDAIASIPESVRTVQLERILDDHHGHFLTATSTLNRMDDAQ